MFRSKAVEQERGSKVPGQELGSNCEQEQVLGSKFEQELERGSNCEQELGSMCEHVQYEHEQFERVFVGSKCLREVRNLCGNFD